MKRLAILALIAIAVTGACSSGSSKSSSEPDWDANALKVADGLKAKLDAARFTCKHYQPEDYAGMSDRFTNQAIPVPLAITNCLGDADEDLTTEVFGDTPAAQRFILAKRKAICDASAKNKVNFPGFVYLDGGSWIFEPDHKSTADKLQQILGGTVKIGDCKGL